LASPVRDAHVANDAMSALSLRVCVYVRPDHLGLRLAPERFAALMGALIIGSDDQLDAVARAFRVDLDLGDRGDQDESQ